MNQLLEDLLEDIMPKKSESTLSRAKLNQSGGDLALSKQQQQNNPKR
jgi:hypothetical protein